MSTPFDLKLTVQPEHIDVLGHVNNVVYVSWMQDVATAHIEALGLGLKRIFGNLNMPWLRLSIMCNIAKLRCEGEEIILRTWLNDINALYSYRQYVFYRPKDQSNFVYGQYAMGMY